MNGAGFDSSKVGLEDIFSRFSAIFDKESLEKLARQSRFIERSTSRLSGWMFLEMNLSMEESSKERSLSDMCHELYEKHGVELTKQSLDERFNTFAVRFIRLCFEQVFRQVMATRLDLPTHPFFNRVLVTDATSFQLPAHLAAFYPGNGGSNSGSSIKIHQQYELLSGSVLKLQLREGKENDAAFLKEFDYSTAAKELHLMDLGYYKIAHLKALDAAQGYFISRYKTGTQLYIKQGQQYQKLDWNQLLSDYSRSMHLPEVYLGEEKLKVRLMVEKLPDAVARQLKAKL